MAEQSPDPWRLVWRVVTSNEVLVALLLAIAISLTLTAWIPQRPSSDADYARWLSEIQGRFGEATPLLRGLGGFRIVSSFGFRVLLAMLAACLLLRSVEGLDGFIEDEDVQEPPGEWKPISDYGWTELRQELQGRRYRVADASSFFQVDGWPWSVLFLLLAHVGALILLVSLLLSHSLGWQAEGLILQGGERQSLPGGTGWVTLSEDGGAVRTGGSPGVVPFIEDEGPGVRVSAIGADGEPLSLILTPNAEPSLELKIALTEDGYFAVPEAELVARLTPRSEQPYSRVDVQVYSSPTGEIIAERVTEKGGDGEFDVAGVTLTSEPAPYARLTITHNPGRLPAGLGLVLLIVGIIGSLMWPDRRFWLRQEEESIEVTGPVPAWLDDGGEER